MKRSTVVVRYKVKKSRVAEHEELIRAVFAELDQKAPKGMRYGAFKKPDGCSFIHVAVMETRGNPLTKIRAFGEFTRKIEERCSTQPEVIELEEIGAYRL